MTRDKKAKRNLVNRALLLFAGLVILTAVSTRMRADTATCGGANISLPFTDVPSSNIFFCSIASAYFSGLTNGTSATTYNPAGNVSREQMAAFVSRTLDQSLKRGSRRAALNQWTQGTFSADSQTTVGTSPALVQCDGADLWVANTSSDTVSRVRGSDGRVLETWTGATAAFGVLVARGRIFVTGPIGTGTPGRLYRIDPKQPAGTVTLVTSNLGEFPGGLTTDGTFIWIADGGGSVSKVDPVSGGVTTFTVGFINPTGILYDGASIWVMDNGANALLKLSPSGQITQTIGVGTFPNFSIFDGINIWVPNEGSDSVTVVRVKDAAGNPLATPFVLATLIGNGLDRPVTAAFDGERILITNYDGHSVSLWKAVDLMPLGSFNAGMNSFPVGACSDGLNFWITLQGMSRLARF